MFGQKMSTNLSVPGTLLLNELVTRFVSSDRHTILPFFAARLLTDIVFVQK